MGLGLAEESTETVESFLVWTRPGAFPTLRKPLCYIRDQDLKNGTTISITIQRKFPYFTVDPAESKQTLVFCDDWRQSRGRSRAANHSSLHQWFSLLLVCNGHHLRRFNSFGACPPQQG